MTSLPYPVYDADNHLYESEEAMTAHLPKKWRNEFCYVDVRGRKKLAIGGVISDFIPNPTFEVLAAPGAHEKWYRAANTEGLTLRELSGQPIACPPAYRNGADRLEADGPAGHPRLARVPDAGLRGRRAHELRPRADERGAPLAERVAARAVGLPSRRAALHRPVHHADGRRPRRGGARVGARARRPHRRAAARARAGLPRQPLARPARVRPVLGARPGGGHLRLLPRLRLGLRPLRPHVGGRPARKPSASCTRR